MARTKGNPQRTVKKGNQNQVLLKIFLQTIYRRNCLFFSKYNFGNQISMASIILRANNTTESSSKESQLMNQLKMSLLLIMMMLMKRMIMVTRCMVEDCFLRTGKHSISPAWWLCTRVDDCHDKNMAIEKPLLSFAMRFPILQARQCSILIKREAPEHSKTIQVANFNIPGNPI